MRRLCGSPAGFGEQRRRAPWLLRLSAFTAEQARWVRPAPADAEQRASPSARLASLCAGASPGLTSCPGPRRWLRPAPSPNGPSSDEKERTPRLRGATSRAEHRTCSAGVSDGMNTARNEPPRAVRVVAAAEAVQELEHLVRLDASPPKPGSNLPDRRVLVQPPGLAGQPE